MWPPYLQSGRRDVLKVSTGYPQATQAITGFLNKRIQAQVEVTGQLPKVEDDTTETQDSHCLYEH